MDLVCTPCQPPTSSVTSTATSAVDDKDTEWRTTKQLVNLGIRQRGEKNCLYCDMKPYKGGPDMIRAHLMYKVKPRSVGTACHWTKSQLPARVQGSLRHIAQTYTWCKAQGSESDQSSEEYDRHILSVQYESDSWTGYWTVDARISQKTVSHLTW